MGARGRKPHGKIEVLNPTIPKRPRPPFGMVARSRSLFNKIVNDNHVEAFDSTTVALLAAFCDVENQRYLATKEVEKDGAVFKVEVFDTIDTTPFDKEGLPEQYTYKENPWYKIMKEMISVMGTLSSKLKIKGVKTDNQKKEKVNEMDKLMFGG